MVSSVCISYYHYFLTLLSYHAMTICISNRIYKRISAFQVVQLPNRKKKIYIKAKNQEKKSNTCINVYIYINIYIPMTCIEMVSYYFQLCRLVGRI
ncbi:hypothetical protein BGZ63DRAFT_218556 [Mariannaea sp. PMI_226]|nr:hypothetical protein BGZ63DRAFT_218556 [Mariannaea sp. PMI_226]